MNKSKANGCETKARYRVKAYALEAAAARSQAYGVELRVYHCRWCKGYHLTRQLKRAQEATA